MLWLVILKSRFINFGPANMTSPSFPAFGMNIAHKPIDNEWKAWIAENVIAGNSADSILNTMLSKGFAREDCLREISSTQNSPIMEGVRRASLILTERLKKQVWISDVSRVLDRQNPRSTQIDRRSRMSRDEFYYEYYFRNRPVIIDGMLDSWPALKTWSLPYLGTKALGDVQVQTNRKSDENFEINADKHVETIAWSSFIEKISDPDSGNDTYMTARNAAANQTSIAPLWSDLGNLPDYCDPSKGPGFIWIGPAGTLTPLHHDLTNNLMAQVMGRKHVRLLPASETHCVGNHMHCYSKADGFAPDINALPGLAGAPWIDVDLDAGSILFLPVGWWHCVKSIEASATVVFTNFLPPNDFSPFYQSYGAM